MANVDYKAWSKEYGRFIYKDENGDWMIDEFGPIDEFSLVRELRRLQENRRREQATLKPKGPIPDNEESRFNAMREGDVDAFNFVLIEDEISSLDQIIQNELDWEQQVTFGKKGGRPGMDKKEFLQDLQSVLNNLNAVAQKNPHMRITRTRIAQELIDKHGYDRSKKYLAEKVSKALDK